MNDSTGLSGRSSPNSFKTSPYLTGATAKNAMNGPGFIPQAQSFRQTNGMQQSYSSSMSPMSASDRDPLSSSTQGLTNGLVPGSAVRIRRLPLKTTEDALRSMVVWSKELIEAEVLSPENSEDAGYRSAILRFKTAAGAQQAKTMLNGTPNIQNDAQMIVEIISGSPSSSRRYLGESTNGMSNDGQGGSTSSGTSSTGPTPRQSSRFNGTFQTMERMSPTNNNGIYTSNELPNPESSKHYQSLFSPQSPIGNHLNERTRISGKSLINNDSVDDDETGELLKDPVGYAENGASSLQPRRATNPQIPLHRMANLSLNTNQNGSPMNGYPQSSMSALQAQPMSPSMITNGASSAQYPLGNQSYPRSSFPPVNPADQNPPCNTLYVGNLPIDTSEDELKAMFSKQRGYKRLCFRTKQNGPMCFVEFEDVSFATKALHELYGHPLHNSIKGGIRLSFSKNPLGVRSGQGPGVPGPAVPPGGMPGMGMMMNGMSGGAFSTANGPPPGLTAPPGLGPSRVQYGAVMNPSAAQYTGGGFAGAGGWNGQGYNGIMSNGNQQAVNGSGFPPAYMMGR